MEILNKILDPKWLIVVAVIFSLVWVTVKGSISNEAIVGIITTPISFYFGSSYAEHKASMGGVDSGSKTLRENK